MLRKSIFFAALPLLLCGIPQPALAQLRAGQPQTLTPPPPPPDPALVAISRFRAAYQRAGSPRMVVLWNQEFSDEVASEYEDRTKSERVSEEEENEVNEETAGPAGTMSTRDRSRISRETDEQVSGTKRVRPKRTAMVSEAIQWQMEESFQQTMNAAGARMIDKATIMRRTGLAAGAGERANVQALEMEAMSQFADWVVEILMTPDSRAPDGVSFRLTVRDLRSARVIGNVMTDGRPPVGRQRLVAGPGGFVRERPSEPGPSQVASQLAIEVMNSVGPNLR